MRGLLRSYTANLIHWVAKYELMVNPKQLKKLRDGLRLIHEVQTEVCDEV